MARTGIEETTFLGVYTQLESIAAFMGVTVPVLGTYMTILNKIPFNYPFLHSSQTGRALQICSKLGAERLLICEHSRTDIFMKILLNVSSDDIYFALQLKNN